MSLFIASLNSGSNGNCYYVGHKNGAVLIDIGISCRETEKRLARLNLPINNIKAVFISHEHTDHVKGVNLFAKKHNLPVFVSRKTHQRCNFNWHGIHFFEDGIPQYIAELKVTPFLKFHDGIDPHSFTIDYNDIKVGVFTDIGQVCDNLTYHFSKCDAAFLEANYCENLLDKSSYPYFLKSRIKGGKGHLSNTQAAELFKNHASEKLRFLLLSHLSRENNHPELVEKLFNSYTTGTEIIVASRYQETAVFEVTALNNTYPAPCNLHTGDFADSLHNEYTNTSLTPLHL